MNRVMAFIYSSLFCLMFFCGCVSQNIKKESKIDLQIENQLIKEKVIANYWGMNHSSVVPEEMSQFVATSYDQSGIKHSLYPKNLLWFKENGDFLFLWDKGAGEAGRISGTWYVNGKILIFVLGNTYSAQYGADTQLCYLVVQNKSGLEFKEVNSSIGSKESHYLPLSGFTKIVISIQDEIVQKSVSKYRKLQD